MKTNLLSRSGAVATISLAPHPAWYRAINLQHALSPMQTSHTTTAESRFHDGKRGIAGMYLAGSAIVAQLEAQALIGSGYNLPNLLAAGWNNSWAILTVSVKASHVLDMTDPGNQGLLDASAQEMTGDWRGYRCRNHTTAVKRPVGPAPTQELGHEAFTAGFEGILSISAKLATERTLVLFPTNFRSGSAVVYHNPLRNHERIIVDGSNPDGRTEAED